MWQGECRDEEICFLLGGVGQDFLSSPDTRVIGLHDFRFRFVLIERRDKGGTCSVVHNEPRFLTLSVICNKVRRTDAGDFSE